MESVVRGFGRCFGMVIGIAIASRVDLADSRSVINDVPVLSVCATRVCTWFVSCLDNDNDGLDVSPDRPGTKVIHSKVGQAFQVPDSTRFRLRSFVGN